MKFTLPISPTYCEHWGLWEAVREIYQNALDEGGARLTYDRFDDYLVISSATGHLTYDSLVLGATSKRDIPSLRGKFGEGYKLALVVLARLGFRVTIHTGTEIWTPKLEHDDTFNATILNIYTETAEPDEEPGTGVQFRIEGITAEQYDLIQSKIRPNPNEPETILDEPSQEGRVFVGGLYVATVKGFKCGYSFQPGGVKLDRDRGMVEGFDLAWQTSKLWTDAGHSERLSELLEAEAPDVEYVESHVSEESTLARDHATYFVSRHGADAVPVSNQTEIQRATAAGIKWVLVPEKVQAMLRLVKSWFIPTTQSPAERLREFQARYQYSLPTAGRKALEEIIQSLEPRSDHGKTHSSN